MAPRTEHRPKGSRSMQAQSNANGHSRPLRSHRRLLFIPCLLVSFTWLFIGPWPASWVDDQLAWHDPRPINEARIAQWDSKLCPETFQPGPLMAGTAQADILEELRKYIGADGVSALPLAGHGKRVFTKANSGEADPIRAKALVLHNGQQRIAIVTADLLMISRTLADAVREQLAESGESFGRAEIYFGATHTHSSIAGYSNRIVEWPCTGVYREEVTQAVAAALARAIREANKRQAPCEIAFASRQLPAGYVKNRTIPGGPTNDWMDILAVRRKSDHSALASVVIFSAHATGRPTGDLAISADYPGVLCRQVEAKTGAECLFLAGAVGGMGPAEMGFPRSAWPERLGNGLAAMAVTMIESMCDYTQDVELMTCAIPIELPAPSIKLSGNIRLSPLLTRMLLSRQTCLGAVRLGDWILVSTPSDYGGELALELRDELPDRTTIVTSFGGDYIGYVLPDRHYHQNSYEPRSVCLYGPRMEDLFQHAIRRLCRPLSAPATSPPLKSPPARSAPHSQAGYVPSAS